jgi:hypothetical protein
MAWVRAKGKLPEVNFAVDVRLNDGEETWDALQFVNNQYVWEKYQGKVEAWRYATKIDWIMAMKAKADRIEKMRWHGISEEVEG